MNYGAEDRLWRRPSPDAGILLRPLAGINHGKALSVMVFEVSVQSCIRKHRLQDESLRRSGGSMRGLRVWTFPTWSSQVLSWITISSMRWSPCHNPPSVSVPFSLTNVAPQYLFGMSRSAASVSLRGHSSTMIHLPPPSALKNIRRSTPFQIACIHFVKLTVVVEGPGGSIFLLFHEEW